MKYHQFDPKQIKEKLNYLIHWPIYFPLNLLVMSYLDCPFSLHEPAAQHCLDLTISQLTVGPLDLSLYRLL